MTTKTHLAFSAAFSIVVVAAVAWGFAVLGTPGTARLQRLDRQRLADLRTIVREIDGLCRDEAAPDELKRALPATLEALAAIARDQRIRLADPATGEPYAYAVKDETTYELCATFALERAADAEVFWNHPAGRHCFTVDVLDPP